MIEALVLGSTALVALIAWRVVVRVSALHRHAATVSREWLLHHRTTE